MAARPFIRRLTRHGRLKLAAFGLSLFLWVLVRVGNPGLRELLVPIDIRPADPGWVVMGDPVPATVLVTFSGPPTEVFRLASLDGVAVAVPVTEMSDEDMVIPLEPSWVTVDGYRGVRVENIVPGAINVRLDRVATRMIPLRVSTRGNLPEHLALNRAPSLMPNLVQVRGPASFVDGLDSLDIVPVGLSDVDQEMTIETVVDTTGMGGVSIVPYEVTLRIPAEESIERVFPDVPVIADPIVGAGPIQVLFPEAVQVTVRGARSQVTAMDGGVLRAVVPSEALRDLGEVEERRVPIEVRGVPSYVFVVPGADTARVRRRIEL